MLRRITKAGNVRAAIVIFPGIILALVLFNLYGPVLEFNGFHDASSTEAPIATAAPEAAPGSAAVTPTSERRERESPADSGRLQEAALTAAATASDAAASDQAPHTPPDTEVDRTVVFSLDPLGKPGCEGATPCTYTFQSTFADGREMIRIDDYPFPDAGKSLKQQQEAVRKALTSFEETNQPYIIGASPLLWERFGTEEEHVNFLNSVVKVGFVVLHGFDHSTGWKPFEVDTGLWETGGEFSKYTKEQLERNWQRGDAILSKVKRYTRRHFIPPFNCIKQDLVDVLVSHGTKYIHTFDGALKKPPADAIPHPPFGQPFGGWVEEYKIPPSHTFVVSTFARSYSHSNELKIAPRGPQITLHWWYDSGRATMHDEYVNLAKQVQSWGRCHDPMHTPVSLPVWLLQALWVVGDVVPSVVSTIGCGGWWS